MRSKKPRKHTQGFFFTAAIGSAGAGMLFLFSQGTLARYSPVFEYSASLPQGSERVLAEEIAAPLPPQHVVTPSSVRAIYMSSWVAGTHDWREKLMDFIDATEINAIVVDVKDYSGKISFATGDPVIEGMGAEEIRVKDMKEFIDELHRRNIYVIGRISSFQDPVFAAKHPDSAVQRKNGSIWKDRKGISWVDPGSHDAWEYLVRVGRASEHIGIDELNFDYVRYPTDGDMTNINYPYSGAAENKSDVIEAFFAFLDKELSDLPVPISVDLFGFTTTRTDDMNIGQVIEKAAPYVDFIAPMVYPSHYPSGYMGFKNPAEHPYEVIYEAMHTASSRLTAASSTPHKLRPWLQDFDLGTTYDAAKIKEQKKAVYDAGLDSWMMWDPKNIYTKGGYDAAVSNEAGHEE